MVEKQKQLLKLLKEIDTICRKNDIEYFTASGTLIGALRHKGFIPWDDDIDIYMTRKNWDRLKAVAKTQLLPNRTLVAPELDCNYTNGFPRYMDTSVAAIHTHQIPGRDRAGEVIDIFILDPIPDGEEAYQKYVEGMMLYSDLVNSAAIFSGRWEIEPEKFLEYKMLSLLKGKRYVLNKIENEIFTFPEEKCHYYALRWGGVPFRFEKRMFTGVKSVPFEDMMVMIPRASNEFLTWHYGDDWMFVPPVTERESHETVSSAEISYREIQKEYLPRINRRRYERIATRRKLFGMAISRENHANSTEHMELLAYNCRIKYIQKVKETGIAPELLTEKMTLTELSEFFEDYYSLQFRREMIGREDWNHIYRFTHPVLVKLDERIFYAAVYTLFCTNRVARAGRLIEIWKHHRRLSTKLARIEAAILKMRRAANLLMDEEMPEAADELTDELLKVYPENISLWKMKCRACACTSPDKLPEIVDRCLGIWPEDGEFLKYRLDCLGEAKRLPYSLENYVQAWQQTNNGLIRLKIMEELRPKLQEITAYLWENRDSETARILEEIFYDQTEALKAIYLLEIELTDDARAAAGILKRMRADTAFKDTVREAYVFLGVHGDVAGWKAAWAYSEGRQTADALITQVQTYIDENTGEPMAVQGAPKARMPRTAQVAPESVGDEAAVCGSAWKLLGDLYEADGMEKTAVRYYRMAVDAGLSAFEKYEIYRTISGYLWTGNTDPLHKTFGGRQTFWKWYQDLYRIPDAEEIENDEIAAGDRSAVD